LQRISGRFRILKVKAPKTVCRSGGSCGSNLQPLVSKAGHAFDSYCYPTGQIRSEQTPEEPIGKAQSVRARVYSCRNGNPSCPVTTDLRKMYREGTKRQGTSLLVPKGRRCVRS